MHVFHPSATMRTGLRSLLQFAAIVTISLVAGSTFGIWQGYDPAGYSARTFLEVHQGAVRGLNILLPVLGAAALILTGILAVRARRDRTALGFYLLAFVLMASAGAITRFANQPINAEIMSWTAQAMPTDWAELRDTWWSWHVMRALASTGGLGALVLAVFIDRLRNG